MDFTISDISELSSVSGYLIRLMKNYKIFLLKGDLGAGKTTLVKEWMKYASVADEVTSPTFSIINEYHGKNIIVFHMDLYRLKNLDEALNIGIEEYLYDSGHYNIIEWPGLIMDVIQDPYVLIEIRMKDQKRLIHIEEVR